MVRQEYLPSNVDEGEFDVRTSRREGTGLGAIKEVALQVEEELRKVPGVRSVLASVGSGFFGGLNSANFYVRLVPHEERTFGWKRLLQWPPWHAFQGNRSPKAKCNRKSASACGKIPDVRASHAQPADVRRRRTELRH
jgi:HAE1 family hydrophobic/amphiphilic exporter-1